MTTARGVLAAILLFGGLAVIVRRVEIGWRTWRDLLEVAIGGAAMGLAPSVGRPDSVVAALARAALSGVGFAALCWWFVDPEPMPSDASAASGGSPPLPPKPPPGPIWLLRATRYSAMLLIVIALASAMLDSMGLRDTLAFRLLLVLGVLAFMFCAAVSIRLWLKQR